MIPQLSGSGYPRAPAPPPAQDPGPQKVPSPAPSQPPTQSPAQPPPPPAPAQPPPSPAPAPAPAQTPPPHPDMPGVPVIQQPGAYNTRVAVMGPNPGLQHLTGVDQFSIKKEVQVMEIVTGTNKII